MDIDPHQMCFGLSLELDRESISTFLQLIGRPALAKTLASRLSSDEVQDLVHYLTGVLKNNMTEDEYHELFLLEQSPHTHK
ncbi:MAG: cytoplasmic protein [Desulfocapsa sp.]|nr:cytoplasmic protein [Desulfocapsa sp.]